MNEELIKQIKELNQKDYKKFIQRLIGFSYFMNSDNNIVTTNYNEITTRVKYINEFKKIKRKQDLLEKYGFYGKHEPFLYVFDKNKYQLVQMFWYTNEDRKNLSYQDQNMNIYNIQSQFQEYSDDIIMMFIYISKGDFINHNKIYYPFSKANHLFNICNTKCKYKNNKVDFILGAGVSREYGVFGWEELLKRIEKNLIKTSNISLCHKKLYKSYISGIGIKEYTIPQLLKAINPEMYFTTIYECLYKSKKVCCINNVNTTLYQIAKIINKKASKGLSTSIVTFNYDDYLERLLYDLFGMRYCVNHSYKGKRNAKRKTNIYHIHGFLPYDSSGSKKEKHKNSIVLSSFEYFDNYQNKTCYAYKTLYNQLNGFNILVGNSVSDFQEQFVLREHINSCPSNYSILLTIKSKSKWTDFAKALYFFDLGLITLYFDDFKEMKEYLIKISDSI